MSTPAAFSRSTLSSSLEADALLMPTLEGLLVSFLSLRSFTVLGVPGSRFAAAPLRGVGAAKVPLLVLEAVVFGWGVVGGAYG